MPEQKKIKMKINNYFKKLRKYSIEILISLFLIFLAVFVSIKSSSYAENRQCNSLDDIILNLIPPIKEFSILFVFWPSIVCLVLIVYLLFFKMNRILETSFQISLIYIIRSITITLVSLCPPKKTLLPYLTNYVGNPYIFNNDLFFSGHVALPFLCYLIFRKEKIGKFFLFSSILMAITVLAIHAHYSIDVVGAFFISYSSFKIGEEILKKIK